MKQYHFERRKMPGEAYRVPCRGSGPTHGVYRDCSPANLSAAITNRWIERPRK